MPWIAGPVYCPICCREWVAVRPDQREWDGLLECPECHGMTGLPMDEGDDDPPPPFAGDPSRVDARS